MVTFPPVTSVMVVRDRGSVGSAAAFFEKNIRRDAMMEIKSADALRDASRYQLLKGNFGVEEGSLHPGQELNFLLNTRIR